MLFYHCTDRIKVPDPMKINPAGQDIPVIPAMYANTTPLHLYGKNAYSFNLNAQAKVLEMSNKMYTGMRMYPDYRAGFFDALKRAGYDAAKRLQREGDTTLVVINFDVIENWKLSGVAQLDEH